MKNVINILLLGMVIFGIAMMADTPWGMGVALAPFAVWGTRFLLLVHRSIWSSVIFWGGIAYFQWQVALVVGGLFGLTWFIRTARLAYKEAPPARRRKKHISGFQDSYDFDQRYHIGSGDK
ncbi:permease [Candidatus Hamiltonella defensa]|uniref:permease n=1 Tax=Candidatus Williamhamiltonella defendens TaxID=138072 RepID=UPI000C1E6D58|nr:permease [Candidatus Hamiltonella defensa]ATW32888.1 permease [Candidatus Hamiltonella defensa]